MLNIPSCQVGNTFTYSSQDMLPHSGVGWCNGRVVCTVSSLDAVRDMWHWSARDMLGKCHQLIILDLKLRQWWSNLIIRTKWSKTQRKMRTQSNFHEKTILKSEFLSAGVLPGCSTRCFLPDISAGLLPTSRATIQRQRAEPSCDERSPDVVHFEHVCHAAVWICPWFWSVAHIGKSVKLLSVLSQLVPACLPACHRVYNKPTVRSGTAYPPPKCSCVHSHGRTATTHDGFSPICVCQVNLK